MVIKYHAHHLPLLLRMYLHASVEYGYIFSSVGLAIHLPLSSDFSSSSSSSSGSPSLGGDVVVYVFDINQPTLPTPFYSVLVSV